MNKPGITILNHWDGSNNQTVHLQPRNGYAVLVDFPLDPIEASLPKTVAKALADGLTKYGIVAGRYFYNDTPIPADASIVYPAKGNPVLHLLKRALDRLFYLFGIPPHKAVPVLITRFPETVSELLDQHWSTQGQTLLVLDPEEAASRDKLVAMLSINSDWTDFTFPPPALALIAPGVDGDYILVAASTKATLEGVLGCLAEAFRSAGFLISGLE